jgi:outer membrane protein OmpA-like peptidoglycan-associated protein
MLPRNTWVHSKLIAADGSLTTSFNLAKTWPVGEHVLQARFKASDGVLRTVSLPMVVLPADGKYENLPTSVVSKTISAPIKTLFNLRDLPNYAKVKLPSGKIRGVDSLTLGGRLIYVSPAKNFSGIILFPISIKGKYTTVERYISLTVQTPAVTGATYQTTSVAQTKVTWNKVANANSYIVTKNKTKVCESKTNSCTFAAVSGPNSIIQIKSVGADGVESKLVTANYNFNAKFAIVSTVNFDNNSSVLNTAAIKSLQSFMDSYKKEGFNLVTVIGYTDSNGGSSANQKLSTQRANTVSSFLNGKETGYVDSIGKGQRNPIKSNATSKGQAANRRVEILVK